MKKDSAVRVRVCNGQCVAVAVGLYVYQQELEHNALLSFTCARAL